MSSKRKFSIHTVADTQTEPFESVEEAWFWFIQAQQARCEGARVVAGKGMVSRPCEPIDILKVVDRLYRNRRLLRDHLLVLRHYGRRLMPPDPDRVKEIRAHTLWSEALDRIGEVLERKGIVHVPGHSLFPNWIEEAVIFERAGGNE